MTMQSRITKCTLLDRTPADEVSEGLVALDISELDAYAGLLMEIEVPVRGGSRRNNRRNVRSFDGVRCGL